MNIAIATYAVLLLRGSLSPQAKAELKSVGAKESLILTGQILSLKKMPKHFFPKKMLQNTRKASMLGGMKKPENI